ncbi:hypothetical protein CR513_39244, partial [Mucuna pruriens]
MKTKNDGILWCILRRHKKAITSPLTKMEQNFLDLCGTKNKKMRFLLNSKDRKILMCALTESKYEKVHNCKSSKEMWDTLYSSLRRSQVTPLRVSKNLKMILMEESLGTLKVHEMELKENEGQQKGKSIALKAQKASKGSTSKAFKAKESYEESLDEDYYNER